MTRRRSVADYSSAYQLGASSPGAQGGTSSIAITLTADSTELQLHFGNFHGDANGPAAEIVPSRAIQVRASLLFEQGGRTVPLTFDGGIRDATIGPGDIVTTRPLDGSFPRGTRLFVRTFVRIQPGDGAYPIATVTRAGHGEGFAPGEDWTDLAGAEPPWPASEARVYGPALVTGALSNGGPPAVAGIGDSIMEGLGDLPGRSSFFTRALRAGFGQVFLPKASASTEEYLIDWFQLRLPLLRAADWALNTLGINDVGQGISPLQIMRNNLAIGAMCRAAGVRPILATLLPFVLDNGRFESPADQVPAAFETNRITYNAWVRDGAPASLDGEGNLQPSRYPNSATRRAGEPDHPYGGIAELAAAIEVDATGTPVLDGGRWAYDMTAHRSVATPDRRLTYDGTHPTSLGHTLIGDELARIMLGR